MALPLIDNVTSVSPDSSFHPPTSHPEFIYLEFALTFNGIKNEK